MKKLIVLIIGVMFLSDVRSQEALSVGSLSPDFSAVDQNGKRVTLGKVLEQGPVVLIFYRGSWCPNCMRALQHTRDSIRFFVDRSATVLAVSPESPEGIAKSQRISKANFSLISDDGLKILTAYGVAFEVTPEMDAVHKQYTRLM
jgi:peroxiredoxin